MELKKTIIGLMCSVVLWCSVVDASSIQVPQSPLYNYHNSLCQQDEFITGFGTSGTTGTMGWFIGGGTNTMNASGDINRPGITTKSTTAAANTVSYILLNGSQFQILPSAPYFITWIARLNNNDGDTIFRIGMTNSGTVSPLSSNGAYLEKAAADTNWFLVTMVGAVAVRTDSGVAADTNWHTFKIVHNVLPSESYEYWLDNVLVGTRTTNIPTLGMQPFSYIVNTTANAKTFDIDYFEWCVYGISR